MHDAPPPSSSKSSAGSDRLSHVLGVGLLLGMALLFSAYLWSSRESHTVKPVTLVTLRPPQQEFSSNIEIVPYQHEIESVASPCPTADAGQLCLIIGTRNATPNPMTFT